jgi:hypothetical protein
MPVDGLEKNFAEDKAMLSRICLLTSVGLIFMSGTWSAEAQIFRRGNNNPTYRPQQYQPYQPAQGQIQVQGTTNAPSGNIQPAPRNNGTANTTPVNLHWSQKILENVHRDHDFGVVAKASLQKTIFEFTNSLDAEIQLANARVSCGCTKVQILTPSVKPGEVGQIEARLDTNNFVGQRGATVTVGASKVGSGYNEYSELRFSVKGMIRTDVVFDPGVAEFGDVSFGSPAERVVTIKYAGDPRWTIKDVVSTNPNIHVEFAETLRDAGARRVDYQMTIRMSEEQPEGMVNDMLMLTTNDSSNSKISFPMIANVTRPIDAANINLGMLRSGETYERKLIVKGKQPFEITQVSSDNSLLKFQPDAGSKTLHIITYEFEAAKEGLVKDQIRIRTSDPTQPELTVDFDAQVVAETIAGGKKD